MPVRFYLVGWLLAALSLTGTARAGSGRTGDGKAVFKLLRDRWKATMIAEGTGADSLLAQRIRSIASRAEVLWTGMNRSDTATFLWPDVKGTAQSNNLTTAYNRIKEMAVAYNTPATGDDYYRNKGLKTAILAALNWMRAHRYFIQKPYENWFAWEIGAPMALNDAMVLMYEDLTPKQIHDWTAVIDHFCPNNGGADDDYKYWGANRAWRATVHAVRGIVGEDESKMILARNGLSDLSNGHTGKRSVFKYVTTGDGFYKDGSFIQHYGVAYTGGYGKSLLANIADVLYVLHDTPWEVTDPEKSNVWDWVQNGFTPLLYTHGEMMDMVRGREIARHGAPDVRVGAGIAATILRLSGLAPEPHKKAFQQAVKYWIPNIPDYYNTVSLPLAQASKRLMKDAAVEPMEEPVLNKVYAGMDRVVHRRKGWGLGLSLNSTRQSYYEAHTYQYENGRGWYTAEGATYLYSADPFGYGDGYWATVNTHRLPGITVDAGLLRADQSGYSWNPLTYSSKSWVGGASDGEYGVAGMEQDAWGATLTSKKSWFFFDDEVVCLGAGINSTDNRPVHTIVENRKLNKGSSNAFVVNGVSQAAKADSQTVVYSGAKWMHLSGAVPGADIGYFFPGDVTVKTLREGRSGRWSGVNRFGYPPGDPVVTNHFQQLWFDHGSNPANATYAYVLLPTKAPNGVAAYARAPQITVLQNSPLAQAVKEKRVNCIGANFWKDTLASITVDGKNDFLTCNKTAAVLLRQTDGEVSLVVSDPTQLNSGTIEITVAAAANAVITVDNRVTVRSLSPKIKLLFNVSGAAGQSIAAKLRLTEVQNRKRPSKSS